MPFPPINIAVFPSEAENAFELQKSLRYASGFKVFGASSRSGHARFVFENQYDLLPTIQDDKFIPAFNHFLVEKRIDLIFPTHDTVVVFFKENESRLRANVVSSCLETARLCREKRLLYALLADEDFCPAVYPDALAIPHYPVFIKPNMGQGAQGCLKVSSADGLYLALAGQSDSIITEYLPGLECTVDCFTDRHGKLLFVGPRSRDVVKMGIAFASSSVDITPEIKQIAETLNKRIRFRGLWFFQIKQDSSGRWKLLETSTRIAGTMGLYRQTGVNFALLAAYDALGMDVEIVKNDVPVTLSRSLAERFSMPLDYDYIYMDLDDTLIVRGKVNLCAIAFIYQCLNNGKSVILLTRHDGEPESYLRSFCIPPFLFESIIHISPDKLKSDYINQEKAIFIDNLFVERREVRARLGIPVFDVDAVEALLRL
ncbi:MAG: hypothetical protein BCS36_08775 [Desulfovibrio sp. MES5]|uniref:ATP-grasp domain-containing protein n=1 Tax=Desulfovibrio sp. MES5 TaxID=1899016 RepID=UPI000B9CCFB6|nr:ATP-grasp domain-containing protein [Desulfovibrio sp. MES5]OXS28832.1 MAG: hypothetical protein BCS36_08775 [Desulfovibrio sp. MES5]